MVSFQWIRRRYLLALVSVFILTGGFVLIFAATSDAIVEPFKAFLAEALLFVVVNAAGGHMIIRPMRRMLGERQLDNALRFTFSVPFKSALWVGAIGLAMPSLVTVLDQYLYDKTLSASYLVTQLGLAEAHLVEATLYSYFMVDLVFFRIRRALFEAGGRCDRMSYGKFGHKLLLALVAMSVFPVVKLTAIAAQAGGVTELADFFAEAYALSFLVFFLMRSIHTPTQSLVGFSKTLESGDFSQRTASFSNDEFGLLASALNDSAEGLEKREKIRETFGKMVSPAVAEQLIQSGGALSGEEREVTILFSDIRSFTSLSERTRPRELVELLNAYFECMAKPIEQNNGVINKFIGDAIMAVFGAPVGDPNHAKSAVQAGIGMLSALEELNAKVGSERALAMGIGIHTGEVIAGTIGAPHRMEYTVIGDNVNVASRLESLTKELDVPLIVSQQTVEAAGSSVGAQFRSLGPSPIKGKVEPVELFALMPFSR